MTLITFTVNSLWVPHSLHACFLMSKSGYTKGGCEDEMSEPGKELSIHVRHIVGTPRPPQAAPGAPLLCEGRCWLLGGPSWL